MTFVCKHHGLWERFAADPSDFANRNKIVEAYLPWIGKLAHLAKRMGSKLEIEELGAIGALRMILALRRFNPNRGVSIATYAGRGILDAMLNGGNRKLMQSRIRRAELTRTIDRQNHMAGRRLTLAELGAATGLTEGDIERILREGNHSICVSLEAGEYFDSATTELQDLGDLDLQQRIISIGLASLNGDQSSIVRDLFFEGLTLSEVAEKRGVTCPAISQRREVAFSRIRSALLQRS